MRSQLNQPANPGAAANAELFDSGTFSQSDRMRVRLMAYLDTPATYKHFWTARGGTERIVNGGGAGEAIAATTPFARDAVMYPGRNRLVITTILNPGTWEVEADAITNDSAPAF